MRITLASPMQDVQILADALGIVPVKIGEPGDQIEGMATDSREISLGDMFIAIP